jgi:hypothetical protein
MPTENILSPNLVLCPLCHEVSSQRQSMTRANVPVWR